MPDDPATLEPSSTQPPEGSPDPAATLEPAPLQAQDQPGGEPAPAEGDKGGAPEPPAWATVETAEALFEHESVKPLHEERLNAARETAKKEGASETHKRLQPLLDRQQDTLRGLDEKVGRFTTDWNRLTRAKDEDGKHAVDPARLQDLIDDNREALAALGGMSREEGVWSGAAGLVAELANAMNSDTFSSDFRPRLERKKRGDTDSAIFTDMVEAIADGAKKPLQEKLKESEAHVTRLEGEIREAKRNGQPSPANPPGGGGGGSKSRAEEDAILMNPETPIGTIKEIVARQQARA